MCIKMKILNKNTLILKFKRIIFSGWRINLHIYVSFRSNVNLLLNHVSNKLPLKQSS